MQAFDIDIHKRVNTDCYYGTLSVYQVSVIIDIFTPCVYCSRVRFPQVFSSHICIICQVWYGYYENLFSSHLNPKLYGPN